MTVHRGWVHMANDEWSSHEDGRIMGRLAREFLERYQSLNDDDNAVVVTVYEHGGWWLSYALIDGECVIVGTANDMARPSERVREFWDRFGGADTAYLETVRR